MKSKAFFLYYFSVGILLCIIACSKEKDSAVPSIPVNMRVNLDDPAYYELNAIGGKVQIDGGYRGIIVYRVTQFEYAAYERTCPYQSENSCAFVSIDTAVTSVGCTCCQSRFQLLDGSSISGPANAPLRSYKTLLNDRELYITN